MSSEPQNPSARRVDAMQYLLLIYNDESKQTKPQSPEAVRAWMEPWERYTAALRDAGVLRGGDALEPTSSAKTVSGGRADPVTTDGPFAETTEQLGGYYLIECDTQEQAVSWAARCPAVDFGRVEVRPVMQM